MLVIYVLAAVAAALISGLKIMKEYERAVVLRLGRLVKHRGPGIIYVIPGIERMVRIDMRTIAMDVPSQDVITGDNNKINRDQAGHRGAGIKRCALNEIGPVISPNAPIVAIIRIRHIGPTVWIAVGEHHVKHAGGGVAPLRVGDVGAFGRARVGRTRIRGIRVGRIRVGRARIGGIRIGRRRIKGRRGSVITVITTDCPGRKKGYDRRKRYER